jgi:hypothetical protein
MNKKQTTMLASIAAVTMVGAMLVFSGVLGKAIAFNPTGAPDYTVPPRSPDPTWEGQVRDIIVEIDSPFGFERITSFHTFQTGNMMKQSGYYTLRLMGPIMDDKRTLLHWVAQDIGTLPDGLATDGVITHGGTEVKMTKPAAGATITKVPLSGKVTLRLQESYQDLYDIHDVRKVEFSGCIVAGYHVGSYWDNDKPIFPNGVFHYEEVDFACTGIKDLRDTNTANSRGIVVQQAMNNDNREIMNEKGELIINSREYRQPIVMENYQEESEDSMKLEIATTVKANKEYYEIGETAKFTVRFADLEGNPVNPDKIKAYYDGKMVQLVEEELGVYTYITPGLTKEHHQLIVSAEKEDFATDTTYLSIPIHRVS